MRLLSRLLIAGGIACLLGSAGGHSIAGDVGRNFARCVGACNTARQACNEQCGAQCKALYPAPGEQRGACQSGCVQACVTIEKDCKAVCLATKNGQSPNQPE